MNNKAKSNTEIQPALRFPEFRDRGWVQKTLADIAPLQRGFDLTSVEIKPGKIPVVYSNGIQNFHNEGMAEGPGLVTGRSGTIGKIHFIQDGYYWPHNTSLWVTTFCGNIPKFVFYLYNLIGMSRFRSGSGVPTLNRNYVHAFQTWIPSFNTEQQKIADCLSSLDELIEAEMQKLESIQRHKRGLMQELFPAEGETLPKRRFPEFENAPEWKEKPLGQVAAVLSGYGFPEKYQGQRSGEYPFYKVSDISASLLRGEYFIVRSANYIDKETMKLLRAKPLPIGTTIFARIGEAIRLNRRVITTAPCVVDNNVAGLKGIAGEITDLFLYYTLLNVNLGDHAGGAVPSVNKSTLERIPVICPQVEEQQCIANCLSSVDENIAAQSQKLAALSAHKKGLMQGLFPVVSEVEHG